MEDTACQFHFLFLVLFLGLPFKLITKTLKLYLNKFTWTTFSFLKQVLCYPSKGTATGLEGRWKIGSHIFRLLEKKKPNLQLLVVLMFEEVNKKVNGLSWAISRMVIKYSHLLSLFSPWQKSSLFVPPPPKNVQQDIHGLLWSICLKITKKIKSWNSLGPPEDKKG